MPLYNVKWQMTPPGGKIGLLHQTNKFMLRINYQLELTKPINIRIKGPRYTTIEK